METAAAAPAPTERDRILDELRRAWDGDPWHGDALRSLLDGMTAEQAAARPIAGAHNTWELVLHLTSWTREVARRLRDGVARDPEDGDWPPVHGDFGAAVEALGRAQANLLEAVEQLSPTRLDEVMGDARDRPLGAGVTFAVMLLGVAQHLAYHAGQIAILRKATG